MRSNQHSQIQMNALCCWTNRTVCMHCMKWIQIFKEVMLLTDERMCFVVLCKIYQTDFCFDKQNLCRRYKKLFLITGGPVNTGYLVVFPSPTPKDCHFPAIHIRTPIFVFTFKWRSWSWVLNIYLMRKCTIKQMQMDWLVNHTWRYFNLSRLTSS